MESFIPIGTLLSAQKHFVIPDYQREYTWGKTENLTLWNDLMDLHRDKGKKHFLGALVTSQYQPQDAALSVIKPEQYAINRLDVSHVLDGQQRITSVSVLIAAMIKTISADEVLPEDKKELLISSLHDMLYDDEYTDAEDNPSPRLFLKEESGKYFYRTVLDINVGSKADKRYKAVKNIELAFELYSNHLRDWYSQYDAGARFKEIKSLIRTIRDRVQVVDIRCNETMNEFQVFESLNGKGLNLTAIDRIKSMYLSKARVSNAEGATSWQGLYSKNDSDDNQFLHFFTTFFFFIEERRVSKIELPNVFKEKSQNAYQTFMALDADLQDAAERYSQLRHPLPTAKNYQLLKQIAALGQDQVYVPLYAAATVYGSDGEEFKKIAKRLLRYSIRYIICGKPSNALDTEFSKMIHTMKEGSADDTVAYIVSRMEDDEEFTTCFARYSTKNNKFAAYLLSQIELKLRLDNHNGNPLPDDYSLEHIIPRTIDYTKWYGAGREPEKAVQDSFMDDYVNSIGNMALLNRVDNSAASNRDYVAKRDIYTNGSTRVRDFGTPIDTYELIKGLLKSYPDVFEHEQVLSRAVEFSKYVVDLWPKE